MSLLTEDYDFTEEIKDDEASKLQAVVRRILVLNNLYAKKQVDTILDTIIKNATKIANERKERRKIADVLVKQVFGKYANQQIKKNRYDIVALVISNSMEDQSEDQSEDQHKNMYIQQTYNWLLEKFPDFRKVNLEDKTCLLTGKPQAGKSGFSFGIALMQLLLEKPVIFTVRNFTQDAEHMKAKLKRFANEHIKQMRKYFPENSLRTIQIVDAVEMSLKNEEEDRFTITDFKNIQEALKGKNMKMVITLANGTQLKCINMVLDQLKEEGVFINNLIMFTDEADAVAYSCIKVPAPQKHKAAEYAILKQRCQQTYEISATIWDILSGNEYLTNTNIISIRPPYTYKGVRNGIQFIELTYKIEKWNEEMSLFDEDLNLVQVYEELMETPIFKKERYNCKFNHPVIILHKTKTLIKHHKKFYELFRTDKVYSKVWTVLMECDKGLYLYSNVLKNNTIHIENIIISDLKGTGEFLFGKRIIIPQLMQWFIDNGGAKRFSHIVIKSGDFSGRSRSYVSTDGNWHLTHQYYGGASNVPDMIQAQRLLHDRPDSIPLIEYAPSKVIDNLVKGDMMQEEQIERLIDLNISKDIEVLTHIQVTEEVWNKEKVPKSSLCCGESNKSFKIQKNQRIIQEDSGWAVKNYKEVLKSRNSLEDLNCDKEKAVNIGKYIVIEPNKFTRGTKIFKLLEDVEKIIIDHKLQNKDVPVKFITEKLIKYIYKSETSDQIHGSLWTPLRTHNKLDHVSVKPNNSLLYWKSNGRLYVSLTT